MAGLWRNNPATREGKYPVILRRDGTVPDREWFVMLDGDPCAIAALFAYASAAEEAGLDPEYVSDMRMLAFKWKEKQGLERLERIELRHSARYADDPMRIGLRDPPKGSDPDAPQHRPDDPDVLAFPSSLADFKAGLRGRACGSSA